MKKIISSLFLLGILMQTSNLIAQTNTAKETNYVGDQKNGQPDGKGVLTDTIGNVFKGSFKKGKKEGYGELTIKNAIGKDSTIVGYWKKDQYLGLYEFPYKILSKSYMISNATVTYEPANPSGNIIEVSVESVSGGSATLAGEMPKPTLTEHVFNKGSFQEMFARTNQQKRNVYIFQNVMFPVTAMFKFGNEDITVELNETKNYKLTVVLRD
ncbi:MAG: hypothetical protein RL387_1589 [Bacteroidota bacterium]|jgi:hypothetical protein